MNIRELIKLLSEVEDQDRVVILQKDAEDNGYSPLAGLDINTNSVYHPDTEWDGEVKPEVLTEELRKQGFTAEDVGGGIPCIVFYPIN